MRTCGLHDKEKNTTCMSTQNPSFHGSASHRSHTHKTFLQTIHTIKAEFGPTKTLSAWSKAGRKTRQQEIARADQLLNQPDLDGDRVLLLVEHVTVVNGPDRQETDSSIFYDKGSTCSMITSRLVKKLQLQTKKKTLIVQSFMHTQTMDSEFAVIEIKREDGKVEQLRAYVVEEITTMAAITISATVRSKFSPTTPWPSGNVS